MRDGFRRWLEAPGRGARARPEHVRARAAVPLGARPARAAPAGDHRRRVPHAAPPDGPAGGGGAARGRRVAARPADTLAERLAAETDDRTAAVLVSAVLFEDSRIVPGLDELASACETRGAELLVDVYHALGVMPFPTRAASSRPGSWAAATSTCSSARATAFCACRRTRRAAAALDRLVRGVRRAGGGARRRARSSTRSGGVRFAGATYDPTSHYRAARVFDFFEEQGLDPERVARELPPPDHDAGRGAGRREPARGSRRIRRGRRPGRRGRQPQAGRRRRDDRLPRAPPSPRARRRT